jgi:hypothetical protein
MSTPPDRSGDKNRRPLISPALMRAFEIGGIGPEEAAVRVDAWNRKFKGADRVVPRSENNNGINGLNAFGE